MNRIVLCLGGLSLGGLSLGGLTTLEPAIAQAVISDGTLNTTVTRSGDRFTIENGSLSGTNLFHSFREFSIPTGGAAIFNNGTAIQNIFSRITGGTTSSIDGLIQANGTANLFLLNPSGILFGANASLNIGGSFVGTTAQAIKFADGSEFRATDANPAPLLTISVPTGLQFGQNPAAIANHANLSANQGLTLAAGAVQSHTSLSALQGTVQVQATTGDAQLQAIAARNVTVTAQGSIATGAITTASTTENGGAVLLQAGKALTVNGLINASTTAAIADAGNVTLSAGSDLTVQAINTSVGASSGTTKTNGNGGSISLQSGGRLFIQPGAAIDTRNSRNQGVGKSGAINLVARSMDLQGSVLTDTRGVGDAGSITVQATDAISIQGSPRRARSGFSASVDRGAVGNANTIQLSV
jgi:filamentous hemagglutinin family protein